MRQLLQALAIASVAIVATGCSGPSTSSASGPSSDSRTSASPSASTGTGQTVSSASASAEAQAALDGYWAMIKRLLAAPDPADPELAQRAVDPSLSTTKDLLTTRQVSHQVVQFDGVPYHVDTKVSSVSDATAAFSGCIVDGGRVVDAETGAVLSSKQFGGLRGLTGWVKESMDHKKNTKPPE